MSLVKCKELRQLSEQDLRERLTQLRKESFELREKRATGQLDRPHRFWQIRREIRQIMTVLGEAKKK